MLILFCTSIGIAAILAVMQAILYKDNPLFETVSLLSVLADFLCALICANFSSAIGGFAFFILLGFAFMLAYVGINCSDEKNAVNMIKSLCFTIACLLFAVAAINKFGFHWKMLIAGVCLGTGVALVMSFFNRKNDRQKIINPAIKLFGCGALVGYSLIAFKSGFSILGLLFVLGGAFILLSTLIHSLNSEKVWIKILSRLAQSIGLILIAASIYFL